MSGNHPEVDPLLMEQLLKCGKYVVFILKQLNYFDLAEQFQNELIKFKKQATPEGLDELERIRNVALKRRF